MIVQGVAKEKILDQVRESGGGNRAALLELKDIENIMDQYGLKHQFMKHPDDNTSIRLIAQDLQDTNELLYLKDQDSFDQNHPGIGKNEFVLGFMTNGQQKVLSNQIITGEKLQICMDSTHCISQYDGFQFTILTITDLNQGVPVAFLISSTVNEHILKAFLAKVKNRVGLICAKVFMSDDDPMFRYAWEATLTEDTLLKPLYINCSWHMDRTFRRAIGSKISAPISEKAVVYQMVRALIDEEDEDNFHKQCQGFLKYLLEADFNEFHKYFKDNYPGESRIKLWPKCFRKEVTFHK